MSHFSSDPLPARTDMLPPRFECSATDGGVHAAWIRMTGELDIATTPQLERMLPPTGVAGRVEVGDRLTTAEPSVGSLQRTLVSSSLLRAGGELRGRKNGR